MLIARECISSFRYPYYRVSNLDSNNLSGETGYFCFFILRNQTILRGESFALVSDYSINVFDLLSKDCPPYSTSEVCGIVNYQNGKVLREFVGAKFLLLDTSLERREPLANSAIIYINGSIRDIVKRKAGTTTSSHNTTIFQAKKYTRRLDAGDTFSLENLSSYGAQDDIYIGLSFWTENASECSWTLRLEWTDLTGSQEFYCEVYIKGRDYMRCKYNTTSKAGDFASEYPLNNYWNTFHFSIKEKSPAVNGLWHHNWFPAFDDGLSERLIQNIYFTNHSDTIYISDILIINGQHKYPCPFFDPHNYNQDDPHKLLHYGNIFWEP